MESEPGEERTERNLRQVGQSEARELTEDGFRWVVLTFDDFSYDFRWEVSKFVISTYNFMSCFEHFAKNISILVSVLKATVANCSDLSLSSG